MKVQQINNVSFGAKLIPGTSGGIKNQKLLKLFEEKTSAHKNLALLQKDLNYSGLDTFSILKENGDVLYSTMRPHSCYSYSCIEEMADEYVKIFNDLFKRIID